jgi:hypothetical protein
MIGRGPGRELWTTTRRALGASAVPSAAEALTAARSAAAAKAEAAAARVLSACVGGVTGVEAAVRVGVILSCAALRSRDSACGQPEGVQPADAKGLRRATRWQRGRRERKKCYICIWCYLYI